MSAELLGLLQACRENPDDDTPRLILADWLIDHGDEDRAEFIRLQIERSHQPFTEDQRRGPRERLLLARHRQRWLGPLRLAPDEKQFERGLVRLSCRLSAWQAFAPSVTSWAGWDWLQSMRLTHSSQRPRLETPLRLPPQLTNLSINGIGLGPGGGRSLAESPDLGRLLLLELNTTKLGPEGAMFLAASPYLSRLHHLGLAGNWIGASGIRALAASDYLAELRSLDLGWNNLGPEEARSVVQARALGRVTSLSLTGNTLRLAGAEALAGSEGLGRFRALALDGAGLEATAVAALIASRHLMNLVKLDLSQNNLGDAGVRVLLKGRHLANLRELRLQSIHMGDEGLKLLAECPDLTGLTYLNIDGNAFDSAGASALIRSTTLPSRMRLVMSGSNLPEDMIAALRQRFEYCNEVSQEERG